MQEQRIVVSTPAIVHPILTDEQAVLIHQALIALLNAPAGQITDDPQEEAVVKQQLSELVYFFNEVAYKPEQFPLRSVEDTKRIARTHRAAIKGPAQPASQRNKRKARQAKRRAWAKVQRRMRRQQVEQHNADLADKTEARLAEEEAGRREQQSRIDRFEAIAGKEVLSNEDLQEVLTLFGSPEAAARARELRAGEGFADRILGAGSGEGLPTSDSV